MTRHQRYTGAICVLIFLYHFTLIAQPADTALSQAINGNHLIEATNSITLGAGFSYNAGTDNQLIAKIIKTAQNSEYIFTEPTEATQLPVNTNLPVGTINGSASVSQTGAANYVIPIGIPPGRNGMMPNLSVVYNSQGGEGLLGLGWAIAGFSSITRTPANYYHEGYIDGVDFDSNDRFALDGQRLIYLSGSEYRTEIESFTKITLYGSASNPTYFTAETKDGLILYFGNTSDSRIEAEGTSNVYEWKLNKVEDKYGNWYKLSYSEDIYTGEVYPDKINYTGWGQNNGYFDIEFNYISRSTPLITYINGSQILNAKLLNNITIKQNSGGTVVGKFEFQYTNDKLDEVIKYGKNNTYLNSTLVEWGVSDIGLEEKNTYEIETSEPIINMFSGDFNGDGRKDLAVLEDPDILWLYFADDNGDMDYSTDIEMPENFLYDKIFVADFDGNGMDDILTFRLINNLYEPSFIMSSGYSFTMYNYTGFTLEKDNSVFHTGDFNGNGKADLLKILNDQNIYIYEFNPSQNASTQIGNTQIEYIGSSSCGTIRSVPLDINGNGKAEIFVTNWGTGKIFELTDNTSSLGQIAQITFPSGIPPYKIYYGDFNGDGMTDLLSPVVGGWNIRISISTGSEFVDNIMDDCPFYCFDETYNKLFCEDMNGDGKTDLLIIGKGGDYQNPVKIHIGYNQGYNGTDYSFNMQTYNQTTSLALNNLYYNIGDFNGDGVTDIRYEDGSTAKLINIYRGKDSYLVESIRNGFGRYSQFSYSSLSAETNYTKGLTPPTFPVIDFQAPIYVVNEFVNGNNETTEYNYYTGHLHRQGKGFLGFQTFSARNITLGISTCSVFEYDDTYYNVSLKSQGVSVAVDSLSSSFQVSGTEISNDLISYENKRIFPYIESSVETNYLSGTTVEKEYSYDNNGNLTDYLETFDDGSYNSTAFSDFSSNGSWLPSRPQTVSTTSKHYQDSQTHSLTTTYTYYSTGKVNTETKGPLTTTCYYNTYGNPDSIKISDIDTSRTVRMQYEANNLYVWKSYNALNHVTERTYDYATGQVLTEKAPNTNIVTTYTYDDLGTLTGISTPSLGQSQTITYGWTTDTRPAGSVFYKQVATSGSPTTKTWYDAFGRELKNGATGFDGDMVYTSVIYNSKGQVTQRSLPYKQGETALGIAYSYDAFSRIVSESSDAGTVSYYYSGKTVQVTNSGGQYSSKTTDSQGNLLSANDPGGTTNYVYKSIGKPCTISTNGSSWTMTYDNYGRQVSLTDPNAGIVSYQYNNFGELVKQIDAMGNADSLSYDVLGRVHTRTREEGTTTYSYDPSGKPGLLSSVTYPGGSVSYTYDTYNRLENKTIVINSINFTSKYYYGDYSRCDSIVYPSGFAIKYNYNTFGYLAQVKRNDNDVLIWECESVNTFGEVTQQKYGNNLTTVKEYDVLGMLRSITTGNVQDLSYSFNYATGNLESRKDNLRDLEELFSYDNLGRLTQVSGPAALSMSYASNGNIQSKTLVGNYSYGTKPHSVTSVTNPNGLIPSTEQRVTYTTFNKTDSIIQANYLNVFNTDMRISVPFQGFMTMRY